MILLASAVKPGQLVFAHHWHGGGPVTESHPSGNSWCIRFDAPVVNPPGVWYGQPDTHILVTGGPINHTQG